jgi:hypothetical protein
MASYLGFLATLAWLVYLFFQQGQPWDESEHAHVAWLISQGQRPLVDFFQHHQPLLWSILTPYYRAGFSGAGVLIWGRTIVVIAASLSVLSLYKLGHWSAAASFIALTLVLPDLFVIRPETLSTALLLAGLALWNETSGSRENGLTVLAGVAAGAAVYASPRFALLGGLFLLLGQQSPRRWLLLSSGAVGFVVLYTLGSGYPLSNVLFNVRFSAHLQTVADGPAGPNLDFWLATFEVGCLASAAAIAAVAPQYRRRALLLAGYTAVVFALCFRLAGMFLYSQAFAPFITAVPIATGWILARIERPVQKAPATAGVLVALALTCHGAYGLSPELRIAPLRLLDLIASRDQLAARVPPQGRVLLYTAHSPITVRDASYYGAPLFDTPDRLCVAVRTFNGLQPLPPCNLLGTLSTRPYLTEFSIAVAMPSSDAAAVRRILNTQYHSEMSNLGTIEVLGPPPLKRTHAHALAKPTHSP